MKTVYGFGDSLVYGHTKEIGMLEAVVEKYGLVYKKYAVNGATVMPGISDFKIDGKNVPDIAAQIKNASDTNPDFVFFDGLTNDAYAEYAGERTGIITDNYDGNYDVTTFCGAFENICFLLKTKYQESRIYYVAVRKMPGRDLKLQNMLHEKVRNICEKWSIPYIDIFRKGGINTCISGMREAYSYDNEQKDTGGNGTHLNALGYAKWYAPMIEHVLKEYI